MSRRGRSGEDGIADVVQLFAPRRVLGVYRSGTDEEDVDVDVSATASSRDAIVVGVLGVDVALIAAAIPLRSTLGHDWWQPLIAIGLSGLLALTAL